MKKILFLGVAILMIVGCNNENDIVKPKEEVTVTVDYSFIESGLMTRSGSDLYTEFYNEYIKTKLLASPNYFLTFKNKETGAITQVNGKWENKDGIKLLEGEYEVTGTCKSKFAVTDTLSLSFNENITIDKTTNSINLMAQYECYMLFFNTQNISNINYEYYTGGLVRTIKLENTEKIFYMMIEYLYGSNYNDADKLKIFKKDNLETIIGLNKMPFEKGKYYYFDDVTNSFNLPPMTEGN